MDFQTHQEQAKQNTTKLIILLVLGVIAIIAVVSVLMVGLLYYGTGQFEPIGAIGIAAPLTTLGVVGTSLVKSGQIKSGGGSYVAASMGGRSVDFNTLDPAERQLANVVEEIAIASGMPVPAVFVLDDEPAINAFAAGWTADNAAIGVTRGALMHLNRRELQGIIAHEFSHIRNGDTRVKTRIIGWVFGIAIITVMGRLLLQHLWWAPRRRDKNGNSAMVMMAAAIGLIIVGAIGTMFARMIQAAVSRQREYLADASAVQYTRDPDGIGDALKKIGGMGRGNKIQAAHATEASHLFFSPAMSSNLATHPPLKDRITRLIPHWDGDFTEPDPDVLAKLSPNTLGPQSAGSSGRPAPGGGARPGHVSIPGLPNLGLPVDPVILAGASAGPPGRGAESGADPDVEQRFESPSFSGPTQAHIDHARGLLAEIPADTQNYLHTRQGAVAAVASLLVATDPELRPHQLEAASLATGMDADYLEAASGVISGLDRRLQLPAIDIALHSIRELPYEQKVSLREAIFSIETSHPDQDLFRWMLRRVMLRHLEDQYDDGTDRHDAKLGQLGDEVADVYAVLAWFNSSGASLAQGSFDAGLSAVGIASQTLPDIKRLTFDRLDEALAKLSRLEQSGREQFVTGATALVLYDRRTTADEAELIRVVADAVRLPVPPLLPIK